jgi:hypothetical protein
VDANGAGIIYKRNAEKSAMQIATFLRRQIISHQNSSKAMGGIGKNG